ncbi:hypothetical protein RQP46_004191 [Phenoliferia psychrophenolica]
MVVDTSNPGTPHSAQAAGAETGLCFFADQQIDRSPTGSCVGARVALAVATGKLAIGQSWEYHSTLCMFFE